MVRIRARLAVAVLVCAASALAAIAADGELETGFKPLFNGKDLTGWDGAPGFWSVKDGAIHGETTKERPTRGNTFLIWRGGTLSDFELRLKFRILGGNSGVQVRSRDLGNWVVGGYQIEVVPTRSSMGLFYEERGRGRLATAGDRVRIDTKGQKVGLPPPVETPQDPKLADDPSLPKEDRMRRHQLLVQKFLAESAKARQTIFAAYKERDWNDMVVIARGNQLIQKINGVVFSEIIDEQEGARATSGVLALQLHAGPPMVVEFKDIRLKPLAPEGPIALFNGKDLTGWRVLDQADFSEHGKVYVKDGVLHLDAGKPMTGVGYTGEIPTSNYEVSFDAMRTDGYDFFCGMTFPVGSSWLTWIIGGWGGTVVGFSNVDDMNASENETSRGRSFDNNHWYHFDLRVTDKEIEASIDGDTIITLAREGRRFSVWEEQSPIKPFGIATWYTGGAVRNLTLKRLE